MNSSEDYLQALNSYNEDINTLTDLRDAAEQFKQEQGAQLGAIGPLAIEALRGLAKTDVVTSKVSSVFDSLDPSIYNPEAVNNLKSLYNGLIGTKMKIKTPDELELDAKAFVKQQAEKQAKIDEENTIDMDEIPDMELDTSVTREYNWSGMIDTKQEAQKPWQEFEPEDEIPGDTATDLSQPWALNPELMTPQAAAQNLAITENEGDMMAGKELISQGAEEAKVAGEADEAGDNLLNLGENAVNDIKTGVQAAGETIAEGASEAVAASEGAVVGGLESAGAAFDATGIGSVVGLGLGIAGGLASIGYSLYDLFDPSHSVDTSDIAKPELQNI